MDDDSSTDDLHLPLIHPESDDIAAPGDGKTTWNAVFNLSKVIIGAGMMAIPRAFYQTGSVFGTAMLLGVACLTYFTLAVLVDASSKTGAVTYSQLTLVMCGRPVMKVLQLAVLAFCFGFGVVYLVIIRDILLGTPPACNGLLCELLGVDPTGLLADPRLVIGAVALLVCAPLLLLRSMEKLSALNIIGVAAIGLLAAVSAGLGIQGLAHGTAHAVPALPQWQLLGPTKPQQLEALTAVLPVLIACYVAHQSLHPLMPLVRPYSERKMKGVIAGALVIAFAMYFTLSLGGALAFGPDVQVNVLNNFSVSGLEPMLGPALARLFSWSIRGGYLMSLLASLLLYMHPLRGCLAEMLWPDREPAASISHPTSHQSSRLVGSQSLPGNSGLPGVPGVPGVPGAPDTGNFGAAAVGDKRVAGSVFATATAVAAAAADDHQDHNLLDDSRVLVAFDSMDSPAFGSWKPGFMFKRPGAQKPALNPAASTRSGSIRTRFFGFVSSGGGSSSSAPAASAAVTTSLGGSSTGSAAGPRAASSGGGGFSGGGFHGDEQGLIHINQAGTMQQPSPQLLGHHRWQHFEQQWYYRLTYGLLAAMVLVAILVPNIWAALSMIGDLASTLQAFVVPGLIALVMAAWGRRAAAEKLQQQQLLLLQGSSSGTAAAVAAATGAGAAAGGSSSLLESGYVSGKPVSRRRSRRQSREGGKGTGGWCSCKLMLQLHCDSEFLEHAVLPVVHSVGGGAVVVLGLALFVNGIYQRL